MQTFEELGLSPQIIQAIREMGFEEPMPIQAAVIPVLLGDHSDLIALAQTGTGKTAAFGLPLVQRCDPAVRKPQGLVLAPTRELCLQISKDLKEFARHLPNIDVVAVYGGADMDRQIQALKKGAQIIVATPGRMNDLLNKRKKIDLSGLHTVVLDEADEMLNMGFKEELDAILEQTPAEKKTLLFSATMPSEVQRISKNYMREPREITVGTRNAGAENVEHLCYAVHSKDRYLALKRLVDYHPEIYGIVFCRTRIETKEVAEKLIQDGYNADALHGDLSQAQREMVMNKFRIKHLQLLVATDVAARGLDVKDLTHIINFNLPDDDGVYTHRSGRTGRAGQTGVSIAIVNLREKYKIKLIERKIKKQFTWKSVPPGRDICEKQLLSLVDKLETIEIDHKEIDTFLPAVYEKLEWLSREELIKHFVSLEFNRFLDYYRDAKDLNEPVDPKRKKKDRDRDRGSDRDNKSRGDRGSFDRSDRADRNDRPDRPIRSDRRNSGGSRGVEQGFTRFHINLGHKDSVRPHDLIGLINRCTRKRDIEIGRIELMKTFSFFDADKEYAQMILSGFKDVEFDGRPVSVQIAQEEGEPFWKSAPKSDKKGESGRKKAYKKK